MALEPDICSKFVTFKGNYFSEFIFFVSSELLGGLMRLLS